MYWLRCWAPDSDVVVLKGPVHGSHWDQQQYY